jgi:hypothetical protein
MRTSRKHDEEEEVLLRRRLALASLAHLKDWDNTSQKASVSANHASGNSPVTNLANGNTAEQAVWPGWSPQSTNVTGSSVTVTVELSNRTELLHAMLMSKCTLHGMSTSSITVPQDKDFVLRILFSVCVNQGSCDPVFLRC